MTTPMVSGGLPRKTNFLGSAKPVSEIDPWLRILLYGPPGVGKTTLAAQAENPVLVDIEDGAKTLLAVTGFPGIENTPVIPIKSVQDLDALFWEAKTSPDYFKTYIIDSVSELQKLHLDDMALKQIKAGKRESFVNTQPDYNESTNVIRRIFLSFRELPCNVIFITQSIEDKDEGSGQFIIRPSVTPKLAGTIISMVDVVAYLDVEIKGIGQQETTNRVLRCTPTRKIQAKNRIGLPSLISDPTWSKVQDLAFAGKLKQMQDKSNGHNQKVS